jgi:mono/diheme cytochrome c family protein
MTRKITIALGVVAALVLASTMVRVGVLAQGPGGGGPGGGGPLPPVTKEMPSTSAPAKTTSRVYDKKVLLASHPELPEDVQIGRAIYQQKCAYCHDGVGQPTYKTMGDWLGGETVQSLGVDAMKAFINTGTTRMPGFQYDLDPKQLDDVIAFIKTIPSTDKPTQSQLDGKAGAVEGND